MKKSLMITLLLFAICINALSGNGKPRCGLWMFVNDYEGTEMVGCYQILHIRVTNPTDTVAYIPKDGGLQAFRMEFKDDGSVDYISTGEYKEEVSLQPGEVKTIYMKSLVHEYESNYFGYIGISKEHQPVVTELDEKFTDFEIGPNPYREWNLDIDIDIHNKGYEYGNPVVYGDKLNATVKYTNKEKELYTPSSHCLYLKDYNTGEVVGAISLAYGYYPYNELCTKDVTFENVEYGKEYYMEIVDENPFTENKALYATKPFYVNENEEHGITVEYAGLEGEPMYYFKPRAILQVHNSGDKPLSLLKYHDWGNLAIYRVMTDKNDNTWYNQYSWMSDEDFIVDSEDTREVKIPISMVPKGTLKFCVGTFNTDEEGNPIEIFDYFDVEVTESREWDITTEVAIRDVKEEDGKNILSSNTAIVDFTFTNNEDGVYTPSQPFIHLYKMDESMDYENVTELKIFNTFYDYFAPHTPTTKSVILDYNLKEDVTYYVSLERGRVWGRSEPFTVNTSTGINGTTADNADVIIYDMQGRRLESAPENGIYLIKTDKGMRKVVR